MKYQAHPLGKYKAIILFQGFLQHHKWNCELKLQLL